MSEEAEIEEKPTEVVRGSLFAALGGMEGDKPDKPEEQEIKPDPVVTDDADKPNDAPPADPVDELDDPEPKPTTLSAKGLRVKRKEKEPTVTKEEPTRAPVPVPKNPDPVTPKEPEEDYSEFGKRERDTLELLKFGEEKKLSDKGTAKKLADYYKSRNSFVQKLKEENLEDEEYNLESDPKYRRWKQQNNPPVEVDKLEEIRNEQIISKAEERAYQRMKADQEERDKEHEAYMREVEREKLKPKVEAEVSKFSDDVLASMPEAVTKAMQSGKEWEVIEEEFPIEAPIVKSTLNKYSDAAEILISMMENVNPYDGRIKMHRVLREFVVKQGELYAKKPESETTRDGKKFVKPSQYRAEDSDKVWTLGRKELMLGLRNSAKKEANILIDKEKKRFDAYMKKAGLTAPAQNSGAEDEGGSPSVKSSPSKPIDKNAPPKRKGLFDILQ